MVLVNMLEKEQGNNKIITSGIAITILAMIMMLFTKYTVVNLQNQVGALDYKINRYKQDYHVLQAEWAYLTSPKRIEILAKAYLKGNKEITAEQLKSIEKMDSYYVAKGKSNSKKAFAMNK